MEERGKRKRRKIRTGRGVGDVREEMMDDVELDNAMENMFPDEAELTIDRGRGTLQEGPGLGFVFGQLRVRVMEVGDGDDPVIDPHIRLQIYESDGTKAEGGACKPESESGDREASV